MSILVQFLPSLTPDQANTISDAAIILAVAIIGGIAGEDIAGLLAGKPKNVAQALANILNGILENFGEPGTVPVITEELVTEFLEWLKARNGTQTPVS